MADKVAPVVQSESKEIALVERGDTGKGSELVNLDPSKGRVSYYSTLVANTPTDKVRIYRALTGDATPLSTVLNKVVDVENVILHTVDITDQLTGEVRMGIRIVLVAPNGVMYGCVSKGVKDSLAKLGVVYGPFPWTGGALVKPVQKGKAPKAFFSLEIPTDEEMGDYRKAKKLAEEKAAGGGKK